MIVDRMTKLSINVLLIDKRDFLVFHLKRIKKLNYLMEKAFSKSIWIFKTII